MATGMKFDISCKLQEQIKRSMGTQFLKKEFKKEYAMDIVVSSTNILYRSDKVERQKHA